MPWADPPSVLQLLQQDGEYLHRQLARRQLNRPHCTILHSLASVFAVERHDFLIEDVAAVAAFRYVQAASSSSSPPPPFAPFKGQRRAPRPSLYPIGSPDHVPPAPHRFVQMSQGTDLKSKMSHLIK